MAFTTTDGHTSGASAMRVEQGRLLRGLREIAAHLDSATEWSGRDTGYVEGIVRMLQAIVDR